MHHHAMSSLLTQYTKSRTHTSVLQEVGCYRLWEIEFEDLALVAAAVLHLPHLHVMGTQ